jgi:hypothetical protein
MLWLFLALLLTITKCYALCGGRKSSAEAQFIDVGFAVANFMLTLDLDNNTLDSH